MTAITRRLHQWAGWLHSPGYSAYPSSTVEYRIFTERENAGAHGDGMKYEIIDGVMCRPDGGLSRHALKAGRLLALDIMCIETHQAIAQLPQDLRAIVIRRWARPNRREKPLSFDEVGNVLGIPRSTVYERHEVALARLDRLIYGPLILVGDTVAQNAPIAA